MNRVFRAWLVGMTGLLLVARVDAARFVLSGQTLGSRNALQVIQVDIEQRNLVDAVTKIEALLAEQSDTLVAVDDDVQMRFADAIEQLVAANRQDLIAEYDKKFGTTAQAALGLVLAGPDKSVASLVSVAHRFPVSSVAGQAFGAAARRAAELGDAPAAAELYTLSVSRGGNDAKALAALKPIVHVASQVQSVPFEATWYGLLTQYGGIKSFPVRFDDRTLFVGDRFVLLLRPNGTTAWISATQKPWDGAVRGDIPVDAGRGPIYQPALYSDYTGVPLVVLVRQPAHDNPRGAVRAIRASDGRSLWTTESDPALTGMNFVGVPTLAGRVAYTVAVEQFARQSNLVVVAQDVASGRLIWQRQFGTQIGPDQIKEDWRNRDLEDFWRLGAIGISEDRLYVVANVGSVVCIDRFDGKLRWLRPYDAPATDNRQLRKYRELRLAGRTAVVPLHNFQILRYRNTPQVSSAGLMVAPQDSPAVFGVDLHSGRMLWHRELNGTLFGALGSSVLATGEQIEAIDGGTGKAVWIWHPEGSRLTGPAVLRGNQVLVQTSAGLMALSAEKGEVVRPPADEPNLRKFMEFNSTRAALAGAGLSGAFGAPKDLGAIDKP